MNVKLFLRIFGGLAVSLTLLPLIAKDFWWIRIFDFPHFQLTVLTLLALLTSFIRFDIKSRKDYIFVGILITCFIYQFLVIFPYTTLAGYEVLENTVETPDKSLSIFVANVLQENETREKLFQQIKTYDADLLLFTETDQQWRDDILAEVQPDYGYSIEIPLSNTYGMLMYSKLPLLDTQVKYIVDDSIPSIHSKLRLLSGDTIQLFAIHPTPPMPQHNPRSTDRDAEMMKIALAAMESDLPVIIAGDFNDVAWSQSTGLFQKISGLLDVRKGRGLLNTYHADYFIFRWPLDHIFVSEHFRVQIAERGGDIESDHFPMYVKTYFEPENSNLQQAPPPTQEELKKAREQIEKEKRLE